VNAIECAKSVEVSIQFWLFQIPDVATTNGVISPESNAVDGGGELAFTAACILGVSYHIYIQFTMFLMFYLIRHFCFRKCKWFIL